jgi:phosphatidylserine decarboxylase
MPAMPHLLTPYGWREILLFVLVFGGAAGLGLFVVGGTQGTTLGLMGLASMAFCLAFFRDPERRPEGGPEAVIAPADGRVTDIARIEAAPHFGEPVLRVGIFLSVFDVHVNRAPVAGRVVHSEHRPGRFLDARDPACAAENEAQDLVIETGDGTRTFRVVVRQIAGLIARRIVCRAAVGDGLARGQRYGMIKFGSRTEVDLPLSRVAEVVVRVGDRVQGGRHVLARLAVPDVRHDR